MCLSLIPILAPEQRGYGTLGHDRGGDEDQKRVRAQVEEFAPYAQGLPERCAAVGEIPRLDFELRLQQLGLIALQRYVVEDLDRYLKSRIVASQVLKQGHLELMIPGLH